MAEDTTVTTETTQTTETAETSQDTQTSPEQVSTKSEGVLLTDDDESTSETSWIQTLPEELRANEKLTGFKSVEELAKAYAEAKLAPTIPEASEYKIPENFPIKDIGEWAAKVGYTQEQLDHMLALNEHVETTRSTAVEQAYKAGLDQLFTEWGEDKDSNVKHAKQVISHFDKTGELKQLLNETRAGNHPAVVKFFAQVGREIFSEDGFVRPGMNQQKKQLSAADVIFDAS